MAAALRKIDDADQTFLNGQEMRRTGAFPPAFDSTWEVPREYYPADGLLRWGATNVLAVRMYDGTGGGGFHQRPVGLFSKARLRTVSGMTGTPARRDQLAHACAVLGRERRSVAAGDLRGYAATLAGGFFHQGDTAARRLAGIRAMIAEAGRVTLRDEQAEVFVDGRGRLAVDTIRSWVAADGTVLLPPTREPLHLDPRRPRELGDHARFFRDDHDSAAMNRRAPRRQRGLDGRAGRLHAGPHHPDVFGSIAAHMGALILPPLAGTPAEQAANAGLRPLTLVAATSAAEVGRHTCNFDGGDPGRYRFGEAARQMSVALASKGIRHDYQPGPVRSPYAWP